MSRQRIMSATIHIKRMVACEQAVNTKDMQKSTTNALQKMYNLLRVNK